MKLRFVRPHLSMLALPEQELPDFTIITGVNGAGKSHLLKAIQNGSVLCDVASDINHDVRSFDWTNLAPNGSELFSGETIRQEQLGAYNQLAGFVNQTWGVSNLLQQAAALGIRGHLLTDVQALLTASDDALLAATDNSQNIENIRANLEGLRAQFEQNVWGQAPQIRMGVEAVARSSKKYPIALTQQDFLRNYQPSWGQAEMFQQSFARLFVAYRDLKVFNEVAQNAKQKGKLDTFALTDSEFIDRHGSPPWDFVNSSLKAAGMSFAIDAPDLYSLAPYRPMLKKDFSGIEISFEGLSSGERVLMSFAFALYYASDKRQIVSRPKLLLLDEIDAPLHPSMCKSLLTTIEQILVKEQGLKVIMTTHSPSTVALAAEESIHVMRPGQPGLHKVGIDAAISDLSAGIPTLSVFCDNRRQVFVESPKDVEVFQAAYNTLKHKLSNQLAPVFIATGTQDPDGQHKNTGCDAVIRIVNSMRAAGARYTFGLLDWDGRNARSEGIHILAEGERNGLESVFFDPLLILTTLIRLDVNNGRIFFGRAVNYISARELDSITLQAGIDTIQQLVLGRSRSESVSVSYLGGLTLLVDKHYLTMDDHDLEDRIFTLFPSLKIISRNRAGELPKWIAHTLLAERIEHCPMCLIETFNKLTAQS